MEVTKKEEQRENKEVKRPQIDPAIIEELMKGCSVVRRPPQSQFHRCQVVLPPFQASSCLFTRKRKYFSPNNRPQFFAPASGRLVTEYECVTAD
jgi:hypothetical protein